MSNQRKLTDEQVRRISGESIHCPDRRTRPALCFMLSQVIPISTLDRLRWTQLNRAAGSIVDPRGRKGVGAFWVSPFLRQHIDRLPSGRSPFIFGPVAPAAPKLSALFSDLLLKSGLESFGPKDILTWARNQSPAVRKSTANH